MAVVVTLRVVTETEDQTRPVQRFLDEVATHLADEEANFPGMTSITLQIEEEDN